MYKIYQIDKVFRLFASLAFRFLLIFYSIIILVRTTNALEWYYYVVVGIIYLVVYIVCFNKDDYKSVLRGINDYAFIIFVLYGKDLNIGTYSMLLFPIFNMPNHSTNKRSLWIYLFFAVSYFILFYRNFFVFNFTAIIVFFLLERVEYLRARFFRFNAYLYDSVEGFRLAGSKLQKTHLLYKSIIAKLSTSSFNRIYEIDGIYCFAYKKVEDQDTWQVVNGSNFVWTFNFILNSHQIKILFDDKDVLEDAIVTINGNVYKGASFLVDTETSQYIYFFSIKKQGFYYFLGNAYTKYFLRPFFIKTSTIISAEKELKNQIRQNLSQIKNKIIFVDNAVLAMHFLRNKIQPIVTYFEILANIDKAQNQATVDVLNKNLLITRNSISQSLREINFKTSQILEVSENPFIVKNNSSHSIRKLYEILRDVWTEYFPMVPINIDQSIEKDENKRVFINVEQSDILFTDIVKNIYANYYNSVNVKIFEVDEKFLNIRFENNMISEKIPDAQKYVEMFQTDGNDEILKRTTHGVFFIKRILDSMQMKCNVSLNGGILVFDVSINYFKL